MQRIRGFLDHVSPEGISGWAFCENSEAPAELELRVDGSVVLHFKATMHRPDLQTFGVHPTGLCGFDLKFKDFEYNFPCHAKVEVTSANFLNQPLFNSPWFYYDPQYLEKLAFCPKKTDNKNVIIVGLPKSGTSVLAFRIRDSIEAKAFNFEPFGRQALRHVDFHMQECRKHKVVTKTLFYGNYSTQMDLCGSYYGKRILLLRDPRDVLVSSFFYSWNHHDQPPVEKLDRVLNLLEEKEAAPQSISFSELLMIRPDVKVELLESARALGRQIKKLRESWHLVYYESLIEGDENELEDYLGFRLVDPSGKEAQLKRLRRSTKGSAWKRWFTDEDVSILKPELCETLTYLGYQGEDWLLEPQGKLDPKEGSLFVRNLQKL